MKRFASLAMLARIAAFLSLKLPSVFISARPIVPHSDESSAMLCMSISVEMPACMFSSMMRSSSSNGSTTLCFESFASMFFFPAFGVAPPSVIVMLMLIARGAARRGRSAASRSRPRPRTEPRCAQHTLQ